MLSKVIYSIVAIMIGASTRFLLQGDFIPFLQWWVTILILGFIYMPLSSLLFESFHDKGYLFSKTIAIAVSGYFMWLLSSLHILKFTPVSCMVAVGIGLLINGIIIFIKSRKRKQENNKTIKVFGDQQSQYLNSILSEELLFLGVFLILTYIRGFKPEAYGTEKFMDYGFMTSMMRSDYMPPQDFWFSGTNLNYYYVGQFLAVFLTKLSNVPVSLGYNLMLMMVGAFAFVLPFSLVYNVFAKYLQNRNINSQEGKNRYKFLPGLSGILAGAGVCIAGNMHYPVYQWLEPAVRKFFGMEKSTEKYWFPNATRFIGYHPETNDKTIHEFPAYSFVLGDLHAHVINILFVLTVLGILFGWLSTRKRVKECGHSLKNELLHPSVIMIGFFIGLFHMTNFWDFPIYYVVSGAVILFSNMIVYNFKSKALWLTALQGIFIVILAELVCLPFTISFDQISTRIRLAQAHTPLNQLIILWGLPIFMVISFLCFLIGNYCREKEELTKQKIINQGVGVPVFSFMKKLDSSDLFILTIGLCAVGLILIPELIYVEDIYSGDYKRANTMFKLTYQAFLMFGISFGYLFLRLLRFGETVRQRKVATIGLILFISSLFYVGNAVKAWYGNILDRDGYQGIDAAKFMEKEMPDDYLATNWLNANVTGTPVVLEANGDSYTDYQRVSVITGLPTVLGWYTHEWLWKSNPSLLDARAADIHTIYTSSDEDQIRELLYKYQISYIYVGKLEQEKYETLNHEILQSLGDIVFHSPATQEKEYETYIIRIKN
ncbi:MAG: hypothetical protein GX306_11015 [Clostridiales bacterium]|nr:hypothetical protein [Clostridiales bacterium]